jgi:hypothetical protein
MASCEIASGAKRWCVSVKTSSSPRDARTAAFSAAALPPGTSPGTTRTLASSPDSSSTVAIARAASSATTTSRFETPTRWQRRISSTRARIASASSQLATITLTERASSFAADGRLARRARDEAASNPATSGYAAQMAINATNETVATDGSWRNGWTGGLCDASH